MMSQANGRHQPTERETRATQSPWPQPPSLCPSTHPSVLPSPRSTRTTEGILHRRHTMICMDTEPHARLSAGENVNQLSCFLMLPQPEGKDFFLLCSLPERHRKTAVLGKRMEELSGKQFPENGWTRGGASGVRWHSGESSGVLWSDDKFGDRKPLDHCKAHGLPLGSCTQPRDSVTTSAALPHQKSTGGMGCGATDPKNQPQLPESGAGKERGATTAIRHGTSRDEAAKGLQDAQHGAEGLALQAAPRRAAGEQAGSHAGAKGMKTEEPCLQHDGTTVRYEVGRACCSYLIEQT